MKHRLLIVAIAVALLAPAAVAQGPDLKAQTVEAFNSYAAKVEGRFREEVVSEDGFHRFDNLEEDDREGIRERLSRGEVHATNDYPVGNADGEGGKIHDWYAAVFIPDATLADVLDLVRDYDRHQDLFAPDVDRSSAEKLDDDTYRVSYRFKKTVALVTATLETEHRVEYVRVSPNRVYSVSRSTKVREVENAGSTSEREKAEGEGRGYMWRANSYWRFSEEDGGVFVECESVTLTNNLPLLLRWMFGWVINGVPKEALGNMLSSIRDNVASVADQSQQVP